METTLNPFEKYKREYWKKETSKQRKGEILNIITELTGLHKKSIIRKFRTLQLTDTASKKSMPVKQGRLCVYDPKTFQP